MIAGRSFKCLFWAVLYCVLYLVTASEEDLMDFDFSDLKEIDWNYENSRREATPAMATTAVTGKKLQSNFIAFDDELEEEDSNPFDWRERLMRMALAKALTNRSLRQKFVEVMPILRVLSSQQRLALSALISAQINARKGQELKLEQVRMMFGDDKNLLLPIVYDIANLVRNSARNFLDMGVGQTTTEALLHFPPIEKRRLDLSETELTADEEAGKDIGVIDLTSPHDSSHLDDFLGEMPDDVIDAKEINEELRMATAKSAQMEVSKSRARRSAEFVHKLIRSMPLSVNEDDLMKGAAGRTIKLNVTSFVMPQENGVLLASTIAPISSSTTPSYQQIEDLALSNLNGTAANSLSLSVAHTDTEEPLPSPEELSSGPRYRSGGSNNIRGPRPKYPSKRKRIQGRPPRPGKVPPPAASSPIGVVSPSKKCERFTASMCIHTEDYPLDQIMGSIRRHKNAMSALLAEYHDRSAPNQDLSDEFDEYQYGKQRREDEGTAGGGMCQSIVRYARPQKARSASGEWKYIVNTGQHTQTLRLEKCTNPQESCSYLTQNYRSHCSQVFNYHRLLSWDKTRGLHVDIFKVPTCCSCQVDGYRQQFPPLDVLKPKDYTPAYKGGGAGADAYTTINDELDYNDDEEDDDDLSYQYSNGFGHHRSQGGSMRGAGYDENELLLGGSRKVLSNVYAPNPTVGSYLSPPGSDEYDTNYAYGGSHGHRLNHHQQQQHQQQPNRDSSTKAHLNAYSRRRPYHGIAAGVSNEARSDLEVSPSEPHANKQVTFVGSAPVALNEQSRAQTKRQRTYSVPVPLHTATSSTTITATRAYSGAGGSGSSSSSAAGTPGHFGAASTVAVPSTRGHGAGAAAHAHEAPAAHSPRYHQHHATNGAHGNGAGVAGHRTGGQQSKSRFRIPAAGASTTSTAATATAVGAQSTTESAAARVREHRYRSAQSSSASPSPAGASSSSIPSLYHVNAIFNAPQFNGSLAASPLPAAAPGAGQSKRINYSYHPIIDFFENNKRSLAAATAAAIPTTLASAELQEPAHAPSSSAASDERPLFTLTIPKVNSYNERQRSNRGSDGNMVAPKGRRIAFGTGGAGGGGGGDDGGAGVPVGGGTSADNSAWLPMVVRR